MTLQKRSDGKLLKFDSGSSEAGKLMKDCCCGIGCNSCDPQLLETYNCTITIHDDHEPPYYDCLNASGAHTLTWVSGCEWSNGLSGTYKVRMKWAGGGYQRWEIWIGTGQWATCQTTNPATGPTGSCAPTGSYSSPGYFAYTDDYYTAVVS